MALLAGALADIVDRRRMLLVMQVWMIVAAGGMGILGSVSAAKAERVIGLNAITFGGSVSYLGRQAVSLRS